MKKYILEVTEEQLEAIGNACELSSRLRSGQFDVLRYIFDDLSKLTERQPSFDDEETIVKMIKILFGLKYGESFGIRESTLHARRLYEIYYLIKHFFAKDLDTVNIYKSKLLEVTNEPKIIIKEKL